MKNILEQPPLKCEWNTSHVIKYARIRAFTDPYSSVKGQNLQLYGRIRVIKNPYSRIFFAVSSFKKIYYLESFQAHFFHILYIDIDQTINHSQKNNPSLFKNEVLLSDVFRTNQNIYNN